MVSRRFATTIDAVRRVMPSLGLAAVLALSTLGPPTPLRADDQPREQGDLTARLQAGEPTARLQVVIKTINVSNDRDGGITDPGAGEMLLMAGFWRCSGPPPTCSAAEDRPAVLLAYARKSFSADSGDTENLNRVLPLAGDVKDSGAASEEAGIAVHAGQGYLLHINMRERDSLTGDDFMGGVQRVVDESNDWGVGLYSREPAGFVADTSLPPTEDSFLCAGCGGVIVGDYLVTYEIRRTPLPDLHPKAIRVLDTVGSGEDVVCVEVENVGQTDAAPFHLSLYVDNSMPPNGTQEVAGLAPGESRETCIRTNLPTSGRHQLSAIVDQYRRVTEMDERNNRLDKGLDRTPLGGTRPQDGPGVIDADPDPGPGPMPPVVSTDPVLDSPGVSTDPGPNPTPTPVPPTPTLTPPTTTPVPTPTFGPVQPKPSLR